MDNLRAALLMTLSMAGFAVEDALIKGTSTLIPTGQVLSTLGICGMAIYWAMLTRRGQAFLTPALLSPAVLIRNLGELIGTLGYVLAFTTGDLSTASAILQAVPLAVVLGGALFLGERVGWRRWTAVGLGFAGVMMVMRPGVSGLDTASLFALQGVFGLAMRDLATRRIPEGVPSLQLSASAFATVVPAGILMMWLAGEAPTMPTPLAWGGLALTLTFGMLSYSAIVTATRIGEMSVIAPFRYARIVFALVIAAIFFNERPDAMTYAGAALIVGSGLYAFWRETRRRQKARAASLPPQPTL